jgi:hypothetical protein
MLNRCLMMIGIITITLVVFSCSGTTPTYKPTLLDRNWGRSYETAIYNQMVNPDADKNLDPVLDLNGTGAAYNVGKYKESFRKAEQKEIVNILKLQ